MGVDSSTQSCKVVIVDAEALARGASAADAIVRTGRATHPEGTSVDPEAWWTALRAAIADAGGMADVSAWAIAGQQHGMVVLDADGRVVRDALLWNDTRSAGAAADLVAEFGAAELARRTGLVPVASFTATKLRWLRDHEPEHAARTAAVALPHDWLTWRLRGFGPERPALDELVTDRSDASGTTRSGRACRRRRPPSPMPRGGGSHRAPATPPAPRSGSARCRATWWSRSARAARCSP